MPANIPELHRFADWRAVIDKRRAAVTGARVVMARRVVVIGQLHERRVLAQRDRVGRGRDAGHAAGEEVAAKPAAATTTAATGGARRRDRHRALGRAAATTATAASLFVHEGQRHVDLGVHRKVACVWQIERAARAVEAIVSRPQAGRRIGDVAHEEVGRVNQQASAGFGRDRETPQDRLRERILDRLPFERILAARSKRLVRLHQHHARPDALEVNQPSAAAAGAAVETDIVRAEPGGQAGVEQELGVETRDLEKHRAAALIPIQREVAVELLHARRAVLDRLQGCGALLRRRRLPGVERRRGEQQRTDQ